MASTDRTLHRAALRCLRHYGCHDELGPPRPSTGAGVIVAAIFGLFVLNTVHYAGLLVTGVNLLAVVPVLQVTIANVLGGSATR